MLGFASLRLLCNNPHQFKIEVFYKLQKKGIFNFLKDSTYLKLFYRCVFNKKLDLKNPKTFNEKLQWLKLYNRKPEYHIMVDKYEVKKYVAGIIGEEYIIPTYGVWDKVEDIEWEKLPEKFVLKTTGGSGGFDIVICKNPATFDKEEAIGKLKRSLSKPDEFWYGREWPYKGNKNRILAEAYMEDTKTKELRDYKFFCMDGVAKALFIATERQTRKEPYFDFFDADFRHLEIKQGHPNSSVTPAKPETFEKMKELAAKISEGIPQVRCDFYEVNGKAYFGEITFFHFGGMVPFVPNTIDAEWGEWITLPETMGGGMLLIVNNIVLWVHKINELKEERNDISDYKIHCFNGEPRVILVCKDRYKDTGMTEDFYNENWDHLSLKRPSHQNSLEPIPAPRNLNLMLELSRKLSAKIPFARIDFYESGDTLKFGEITFFPASGLIPFEPSEWDRKLGDMLEID